MNYYTESVIVKMLKSISIPPGCELKLVIVDNSNSLVHHDLFEDICSFDFVEIMVPHENLGYFGGVNWVLSEKPQFKNADYLGIVNPDIIFEKNFLIKLAHEKISDDIGVLAPGVINMPTETLANPLYETRLSSSSLLFKIFIHSNRFLYLIYDFMHRIKKNLSGGAEFKNNRVENITKTYIYAPHGSLMLFTNRYINIREAFKHVAFLYSEELFVAETCRIHNMKVVLAPYLEAVHFEHIATDLLSNKVKVLFAFDSLMAIYKAFYR